MSGPYEKLILNPVEFTPTLPEIDISRLIGAAGPDYGESSVVVERIKKEVGEGVTSRQWPSVECSVPLVVSPNPQITQAEAFSPIEAFVSEVQRKNFGWIRREFADAAGFSGSVACPVDAAALPTPKGLGYVDEVTMKLMRHPFWFATMEVEAGEASASNVRDLQLELADLLGTAPGLIRVVVKNEGTEDWRGCLVSIECDDFSSAPTAKPKYEAAELTPQGGSVISAASPPEVRAVGTVAAGTAAISPNLPAGTVEGDLLVMCVESGGVSASGEAEPTVTAAGWTAVPNGTEKKGNTRLSLLYRIAEASNPRKTNDTGDHQLGRIIGFKAGTFDPANPFNISAKGTQAATKAVSIPGATTTRDNCLILACASGNLPDSTTTAEFSGVTNASLIGLTERIDNTTAEGDGGALFAATGVKATAGAYSATTVTAVTEAERVVISLAINPIPEVKCPPLTAGWVTVLSSQIAGVGHMTHVGTRRLAFRINDVSSALGDVQWRLEWRSLGEANWRQTTEGSVPIVATAPVVGEYQLVDLGECRPERSVSGDQRWEWRLQARSLSGSGKQPLVRDVYPASGEQWLRVSDPSSDTVDGEPVALGGTVEDAATIGEVAWKAHSGSGAMGFSAESKYPTLTLATPSLVFGNTSHYLKVTNFNFASLVPAAAKILGVVARAVPFSVTGNQSSGIVESKVFLVMNGSIKESGQNKARNVLSWVNGEARSWGGPNDLWGLSIARSDVILSGFGIAIALSHPTLFGEETSSIALKAVELTVAYSEGGNENRICFASRSIEFSDSGVRRQHTTDEVWGEVVPEGMLLDAPVAGQEGKPARVLIVPSVGDFAARADSASVEPSAKVMVRPAYLHAREAAS